MLAFKLAKTVLLRRLSFPSSVGMYNVHCTLALVECHKITCPTPQNMGIDIKTDDLAHFWDFVILSSSPRRFNFGLG